MGDNEEEELRNLAISMTLLAEKARHEIAHHRLQQLRKRLGPAAFVNDVWGVISGATTAFLSVFGHWSGRAVHRPPGARLDAFSSFFFSKRTYQTVLKPYLAELQEEYFEALKEGRSRKARWVRLRGVVCFWSHVLLQLPVSATRLAKKLWTVSGG